MVKEHDIMNVNNRSCKCMRFFMTFSSLKDVNVSKFNTSSVCYKMLYNFASLTQNLSRPHPTSPWTPSRPLNFLGLKLPEFFTPFLSCLLICMPILVPMFHLQFAKHCCADHTLLSRFFVVSHLAVYGFSACLITYIFCL